MDRRIDKPRRNYIRVKGANTMKLKIDLDAWRERQRQIEHKRRYRHLNTACPHCHTAVLEELMEAAHAPDGYGPKASTTFECPHCEKEITFILAWKSVLYRAIPVVEGPAHGP